MIAADTSSMVAFLNGEVAKDVDILRAAIEDERLLLPPVALSELLSAKNLEKEVANLLCEMPLVNLPVDFWIKVGELRRKVLLQGKKARLADAMIAMCCIESSVPLVTRDSDFRHYVEYGLELLV